MAFDPRRDKGLVGLPAGHLFGRHTTSVAIKRGVFLRDFVYVLMEMLAPELTRDVVSEAVAQPAPPVRDAA
jgi:LysR family cys regulon transcriptional activator